MNTASTAAMMAVKNENTACTTAADTTVTTTPVSYTHLDVYKRQVQKGVSIYH